jgi:hypothetical protein
MWHVLYGLPVAAGEPGKWHVKVQNGDDFTPADEAPAPQRLAQVRAISQTGVSALEVCGDRETGVDIDASQVEQFPAWVVAQTAPLAIELAPEKFLSYLKHEGLSEVILKREETGQSVKPGRELYSKYIKIALPGEHGAALLPGEAVGFPVEIVPLTSGPLQVGGTMRVRVLFRGSAAAGLQVRVSNRGVDADVAEPDILGRTNADGELDVILSRPGYWRLHTIMMLESESPEADWESWWACLTFRLP